MTNKEITDIVYDTLMRNTDHVTIDLSGVTSAEVDANAGLIEFAYGGKIIYLHVRSEDKQ